MSRSQLPLVYKHFRTLEGHKASVNSVRFCPEGELLATGDNEGYVFLWTTTTGNVFDRIRVSGSGAITDILWAINAQNQLGPFFSTADGSIFVYTDRKFSPAGMVKAHGSAVEMLAFDVFYRHLASVRGGELKLWDVTPDWVFTESHTEPSKGYIAKTAYSRKDYSFIVTASASGDNPTVKVWNAKRDAQNHLLERYPAAVLFCLIFSVLVACLMQLEMVKSSNDNILLFLKGKHLSVYSTPGPERPISSPPLTLTTTIYLTVESSEKSTHVSTDFQHILTPQPGNYTFPYSKITPTGLTPSTEPTPIIESLLSFPHTSSYPSDGTPTYRQSGELEWESVEGSELRRQPDLGISLIYGGNTNVLEALL
ncbi:hypothetical protein M422DRAFT_272270 [Sphaerobolus stellatus SS14]|uniref:Uncharacterized protein n=1 Tax=Sphaerobolus stellatus (strain SS14) TaxID=990650 RepID=A0A0C9UMW2_SPHS4|nr:hypothetical protein M422DRAFT_272270 [Sphaerobolus stellatus SS14]